MQKQPMGITKVKLLQNVHRSGVLIKYSQSHDLTFSKKNDFPRKSEENLLACSCQKTHLQALARS